MKKNDLFPIIIGVGIILFFLLESGRAWYGAACRRFPLLVTFVKFALFAALLSVALGLFLGIAARKKEKSNG